MIKITDRQGITWQITTADRLHSLVREKPRRRIIVDGTLTGTVYVRALPDHIDPPTEEFHQPAGDLIYAERSHPDLSAGDASGMVIFSIEDDERHEITFEAEPFTIVAVSE